MIVGLDFETKSSVDIKKHGLGPYFASPDFEILWAGWAMDGGSEGRIDFFQKTADPLTTLRRLLHKNVVVAHNVSFERMCLKHLNMLSIPIGYRDSAVVARAMGAGGHLANAAPQLLDDGAKMEEGLDLIKKFSVPQEDGRFMTDHMYDWTDQDRKDYELFGLYCQVDARLSRQIMVQYGGLIPILEWEFETLTDTMNQRGWTVDLDSVRAMQARYEVNLQKLEAAFTSKFGPLNFRSTPQLRKFCADRSMRTSSFDELHVHKYLVSLNQKIVTMHTQPKTPARDKKLDGLLEIEEMLRTKKQLGGSSLSKLETIQAMVDEDGQLRNQYMHIGAGQTYRTSGRGVQMQNLRRLSVPRDMNELHTGHAWAWSNDDLARNMRQVFTAYSHRGQLVVGDFSSVESRGLAVLAGADWKVRAYADGKDMYKVLAEKMTGTPYDKVSKDQRQMGKVGELSCGYGAGPSAVQSFAEKMGVELDAEEAAQIVTDWRDTNPEVVAMWAALDAALRKWREDQPRTQVVPLNKDAGIRAVFASVSTPQSIIDLYPNARTLRVSIQVNGVEVLARIFQGVHTRGADICYLKPNENKSGPLWRAKWSKNGQTGYYKLYGGKLTGILTQSFCREIFFQQARELERELTRRGATNCKLIGQFHDELVVDWRPPALPDELSLETLVQVMQIAMSHTNIVSGFPMAAEVKHDYRYIK